MKISFFPAKRLTLFLLVSCLLSACAAQNLSLYQADLENAYHSAVLDAERAEPSEISKNLVAVVPSNPQLVWKNKNDAQNARILVVTWTDYNGYDDKIGQSLNLSREIWVTTAPEVKNFCKTLQENRVLRLEQLLGLPPKAGKTKFVEMWDSEAETEFRTSNKFVKVSDDYVKWYNELKMKSYGNNGYPWTRLGYTYDWGDKRRHIGLSEFVIMPRATVEINAISSTMEY